MATSRDTTKKDIVLLQLALVLLRDGELSYDLLHEEYGLARRTAERYLQDLRGVGLPLEGVFRGREKFFRLAPTRGKKFSIEAVDVPPSAAKNLSLLLVASHLLPAHLGVRQAVDSTVRAALRLRGMSAARELRRLEDAVMVLENDAKDYTGVGETFGGVLDAVLKGILLHVQYHSPRTGTTDERFYAATIGLYRGGLYVLAVNEAGEVRWRALERIVELRPAPDERLRLTTKARLAALDQARSRWGPARPRPGGDDEQLVTLHFSAAAAPYVLARPWHPRAKIVSWDDEDAGGARMSIRLTGDTSMFESWVRSWGAEVQILRPQSIADRVAESLALAAARHRSASQDFRTMMTADDGEPRVGESDEQG